MNNHDFREYDDGTIVPIDEPLLTSSGGYELNSVTFNLEEEIKRSSGNRLKTLLEVKIEYY